MGVTVTRRRAIAKLPGVMIDSVTLGKILSQHLKHVWENLGWQNEEKLMVCAQLKGKL